MGKINSLQKVRLKNAQHFAFIQAFITALTACGFTAQRIVSALAALSGAFGVEDQYYMKVRASDIVAQREAADTKRDRFYTRLHRLVQAWAGSGMAVLDAAATALIAVFNLYKVKINAQMDEETGQLENLITDLSTPEMLAKIEAINGTYLFQQMKEGQDEVKALRLEQGAEESEKVYGALASARKGCDRLYDETVAIIEGAALFADDPTAYEAFIKQWNGTVKLYQDMLDRKQNGKDEDGSGSSSPSGNNSPSGSGSGSGSGSEQGGGTGTVTPGGDDNGGGSGSGSGDAGSGDNGGGDNGGGDNSGGTPDPDGNGGFDDADQ